MPYHLATRQYGRETRIRTQINGFGDRYASHYTISLIGVGRILWQLLELTFTFVLFFRSRNYLSRTHVNPTYIKKNIFI